MRARAINRRAGRRLVFQDQNIVMLGGELAGRVSFWSPHASHNKPAASFQLHSQSRARTGQRSKIWIQVRCFGEPLVRKLAQLNLARGDLVLIEGTLSMAPKKYSDGSRYFKHFLLAEDVHLKDRIMDGGDEDDEDATARG